MGSSCTRDRPCVSYTGKWILHHWTTKEAPTLSTLKLSDWSLNIYHLGREWMRLSYLNPILHTVGTGKQLRVPAKALSKNFFGFFFWYYFISLSDLAPRQVRLQCKDKTETKSQRQHGEQPLTFSSQCLNSTWVYLTPLQRTMIYHLCAFLRYWCNLLIFKIEITHITDTFIELLCESSHLDAFSSSRWVFLLCPFVTHSL